jgi:hypothetical protein
MATDGRGKPLKDDSEVLAPMLDGHQGSESARLVKAGKTSSKVRYGTGEEKSVPNNQIFNLGN